MTPFSLLHSTAGAVSSIEKLRDYIHGGQLTDALSAMGDVLFVSAVDHLRAASNSRNPAEHISHAAADMQTAYFAFCSSARRGPSLKLRRLYDSASLGEARGKATSSASVIAALRAEVSDTSDVRLWLDRTARNLVEHYEDVAFAYRDVRWARLDYGSGWHFYEFNLSQHLDAYFYVERHLLPPNLRRPVPPAYKYYNEMTESDMRWVLSSRVDRLAMPQYPPGV
jgi:hypothetical protein